MTVNRERPADAGARDRQQWAGSAQQFDYGATSRRVREPREDADYRAWRDEQLRSLDRDYDAWRGERRQAFADEFALWRESRRRQMSSDSATIGMETQSSS